MRDVDADIVPIDQQEDLEGIEESELAPGLHAGVIINRLKMTDEWTSESEPITVGQLSWRPDLYSVDRTRVLHIHLANELRMYLKARLQMVRETGVRVVIALQLQSLYQAEVVSFLGEIDAEIMIIESAEQLTISQAEHVLSVLSDRSVPVNAEARTAIARRAWNNRSIGDSDTKGRRFEGLLAFLLNQTVDFKVVERNLRSLTDELDIVVQVQKPSDRCWQLEGAPFILVEAKNWADPVGQEVVSVFHTKLATKRQMVRIGILFTTSRFTSAAEIQEVKFAEGPTVIAMVDGSQMESWIDSSTPDDYLESVVRRSMLR